MLASLRPALNIDDAVLVELEEPTSCATSALMQSLSSCVSDVGIVLRSPFDSPLVRVVAWDFPSNEAGCGGRFSEGWGKQADRE